MLVLLKIYILCIIFIQWPGSKKDTVSGGIAGSCQLIDEEMNML